MRVPFFEAAIDVVIIQALVEWLGRPQDHIGWLAVIDSDQRTDLPKLVALYLRQTRFQVDVVDGLVPGAAVGEDVPLYPNFLRVDAALRRGSPQLLGGGGVHEVQDKSAHTAVNLFFTKLAPFPLGFGPAQHDGIVCLTVRLRRGTSEHDTIQLDAFQHPNCVVHGLPFLLLIQVGSEFGQRN